MKRLFGLILVLTFAVVLAACGNENKSGSDDKKVTVGTSPAPHAEVLEKAEPLLEKKGYELSIKTVNDYTIPSKLLDKDEIDANHFQHTPYLNTEKKDRGYRIVSAGGVHLEPMAVYSKKCRSLEELPKGATVYISNNPAEQGRFLKFFAGAGLIKIKKDVKIEDAKFSDIMESKKNIRFSSKQSAELLPKIYQNEDADAVITNSNFAIEQELNPRKDSIAVESAEDNPYTNLIAVKEGHQDDKKIRALTEILQSKDIQDFTNEKYNGVVTPTK